MQENRGLGDDPLQAGRGRVPVHSVAGNFGSVTSMIIEHPYCHLSIEGKLPQNYLFNMSWKWHWYIIQIILPIMKTNHLLIVPPESIEWTRNRSVCSAIFCYVVCRRKLMYSLVNYLIYVLKAWIFPQIRMRWRELCKKYRNTVNHNDMHNTRKTCQFFDELNVLFGKYEYVEIKIDLWCALLVLVITTCSLVVGVGILFML